MNIQFLSINGGNWRAGLSIFKKNVAKRQEIRIALSLEVKTDG